MLNKVLILIMAVVLSSCASTPPPAPAKVDLIYKLEQLEAQTRAGTSPYSIKLVAKLLKNPGRMTVDGVSSYKKWWCIKHPDVEKYAENMYYQYCKAQGGEWDGKNWCRSTDDKAIFYINDKNRRPFLVDDQVPPQCTAGRVYAVVGATSEGASSQEAWDRLAKTKYHYQSKATIAEAKAAREKRQKNQVRLTLQQRKMNAAAIVQSGVGTKICNGSNNLRQIGFVERIQNNKIRISITETYVGDTYYSPGSFKPYSIWENPANWHKCQQSN